jgi:hypothetical protein
VLGLPAEARHPPHHPHENPGRRKILIGARVVRSYKVPGQLARFVPSGFCICLLHAPEEYFQMIASLLRVAA